MKPLLLPPPLRRRSVLVHGFVLLIRHLRAPLWAYGFNLGIALIFSLRLHAQLAQVLDHSLAAERLNSAFDLGTLQAALHAIPNGAVAPGNQLSLNVFFYLLVYFVLVPGTLFCYQATAPASLRILISSGLTFFWRFVRITALSGVISLGVLLPLLAVQNLWCAWVDDRITGVQALWLELPGAILLFLVAALLRLYFDLVEVYTVLLAEHFLPSGKPDRRVRKVLRPALLTLRRNFARAYGTFLLLTLASFAAAALATVMVANRLPHPSSLPIFLVSQAGLFAMLLTRFWQRAAETVLASDNPLPALAFQLNMPTEYPQPALLDDEQDPTNDPQPDPEPIAPSLPQPDPGVFHHEPGEPTP